VDEALLYAIPKNLHLMAKVEVRMPKMGESITEGSVIAWHKQVGDPVELDEVLLEIGTDKVDTDVPAPAGGVVTEIFTQEGETVPVGHLIAMIATESEDSTDAMDSAAVETPRSSEPASSVVQAADTPVVMPKMGESITEGTVIVWHKEVGDPVELDETLLEIGTDKVDTDVPAPAAGILREILVPEGETVEVGTTIALIGAEGTTPVQDAGSMSETAEEVAPPAPGTARAPASSSEITPSDEPEQIDNERHLADGRFLSPLVRSIAQAENISRNELSGIKGSGREGRLTKRDLVNYLKSRKSSTGRATTPVTSPPVRKQVSRPVPTDGGSPRVEVIQMGRMRQLIAEHMTHSKRTSAHVTSFAEVDVTRLVQIRDANKQAFLARDGVKLTYTPFLVHAAVEALREFPILNSSVERNQILVKKDYHIGIAVAIKESGLIVPVIRHAGRLSIAGLAHAASDLARRARSSELLPDDLQGGTFTLTNVGSLGSLMGTPIILQPQVAILATGSIKKRPIVVEHPEHGDTIAIRHMMVLSLSYDHRVIDGAMGIAFLRRYTEVLENLDPEMEL
jgi:2-oxoglutarate dehydrogenase E2 component (dihydrolipoamide succinyltransferase)